MSGCRHDILHRRILALRNGKGTCPRVPGNVARRNVERPASSVGWRYAAGGRAGSTLEGTSSENRPVNIVANLVNYDVPKIRVVGYADRVGYRPAFFAGIA